MVIIDVMTKVFWNFFDETAVKEFKGYFVFIRHKYIGNFFENIGIILLFKYCLVHLSQM